MTVRSHKERSDAHETVRVVSLDQNGQIEILDASVLDLIAGGTMPAPARLSDNNSCTNGSCLKRD